LKRVGNPLYQRMLDLAVGVGGLLLLSPLMCSVAIAVWMSLGPPVFFRQTRAGLHGRPFRLCKFRTMADLRDQEGRLLPDEKRLTRVGRFLRSTSLDELPEIFNVLKGEMSIVGPRPLLMQYLARYSPRQMRRHEVRPGLTGWAQVNGRNAISWEEKFELDVWYVENRSLWLDLKIIAMTILKVLRREGISQEGRATMEEFMGNEARSTVTAAELRR